LENIDLNSYSLLPAIPKTLIQRCRCRLVFGRWLVLISAGAPAILTETFKFSQSLQTNSGTVPRLDYELFLPNSFQINHWSSFHRKLLFSTLLTSLHNLQEVQMQDFRSYVLHFCLDLTLLNNPFGTVVVCLVSSWMTRILLLI
jgi:hypothetical protein